MKTSVRIIGDVHGKIKQYLDIAKQSMYSIQVGDMGFNYDELSELNCFNHRFIGGNHDNYDQYYDCCYGLGDFGNCVLDGSNFEFFYLRGAMSIDALHRVRSFVLYGKKSWWYEEELSINVFKDAIKMYKKLKPKIVITHDCPTSVKKYVSTKNIMNSFGWPENYNSITQQMLEVMFQIHQPEMWIFGHYHKNVRVAIDKTVFVCLDELNYIDLE